MAARHATLRRGGMFDAFQARSTDLACEHVDGGARFVDQYR